MKLYRVLERFETINWKSDNAPPKGHENYRLDLDGLLKNLDNFQIAARHLDRTWGKLSSEDLIFGGNNFNSVFDWWNYSINNVESVSDNTQKVVRDFIIAKEKLKSVEGSLKNHIIRHLKPKKMGGKFIRY